MDVRILHEECAGSQPPMNRACPRSASVRDSQDFEAGGFQPRARLAAQSFGRVALAESLAHCRVIGLSHKWVRHGLAGQLRWIFWPSRTSHAWPHRSQVHCVTCMVLVIRFLTIEPHRHHISSFLIEGTVPHDMVWNASPDDPKQLGDLCSGM